MPTSGKILGIDLGTTNSCMAMILQGELVVIPNREGQRTTPSVVGFLKDGNRIVGSPARQQATANPEATVFSIKRFMGRKLQDASVELDRKLVPYSLNAASNGDVRIKVSGKDYSPPEVSAMILAKLKADAESHIGEAITQAIVTVPAYFNDSQRQATKDAGKIAGLEVLRIINEPTAASLACGLDQKKNLRIAVYDLGGGTFDISILELGKGIFEVRATNGDTHLGGDDFDQTVINLLIAEFQKTEGIDLTKNKIALQRLKEAAEKAKIDLSNQLQAEVNLPFICQDEHGATKHLVFSLTREKLESICLPLIQATLRPCEAALNDAKLSKNQIDEIILVGGMTRMPAVVKAVTDFFGKPPHAGVNPDEAVAIGAAIQGGILKGEIRDTLLLDVTPLSLGVRTEGGLFSKIIEKNTTVPTRKSQVYTTANDNQTSVRISVFQGEKPIAAENMFLGDFELVEIKKAPRGVPQIEVVFDIDANGIIRVSAKDKETKQSQQIRIAPNSGLRQDEIQKMIKEAEEHAKANLTPPEVVQYRKTCQMLFAEARKEINESQTIAEAMKKDLFQHLNTYEQEAGGADLIRLKDLLKELNQFLVEIRRFNGNTSLEAQSSNGLDASAKN